MGVKVTGLEAVRKRLNKLTKVKPSTMDKVGAYAVQAITDRTMKGIDIYGMMFKPYKPSYIQSRVSKGRADKVDLNDKGNMLAAIKYRRTIKSVVIYFNSRDEMLKAHGHHFGNAKKGLPRRMFFGLSRKERKHIARMVRNA